MPMKLKNLTATDIILDDLTGITVLANSELIFDSAIELELTYSTDVTDAINNDTIVLIDSDGTELNKDESLMVATIGYDLEINNLSDVTSVSPTLAQALLWDVDTLQYENKDISYSPDSSFKTGQHLKQVNIQPGSISPVEILAFDDATVGGSNPSWIFNLSSDVNITGSGSLFHIEIKPGQSGGMGALAGDVNIAAYDTDFYGGGRFGGGAQDYYFKGNLNSDKTTFTLTLTKPTYFSGADGNLQLRVLENGLSQTITSKEYVDEKIPTVLTEVNNELPTITTGDHTASLVNQGTQGSLRVYKNGLRQQITADYSYNEVAKLISFTTNFLSTDVVVVDYKY